MEGAFIFLLVFGAFVGTIIGCAMHDKQMAAVKDRRENANFRQGQEALNCGDLDLAIACANEEIKHESKRARGRWLRGDVFHHKGMYEEAIEEYGQAIRLWPKEGKLYRARGDSYAALGFYAQAIADYSDAIRLNPADTIAIEHRKAAYAEREVRGDASQNDLPDECAMITELPPVGEEDISATDDKDLPSFPIQRPAVNVVLAPKAFNPLAMTGFILGLTSIVLYVIGIIPILGIVFSAIGLGRFNPETQKAKWMGGWGLALSIIFTIMFLSRH